jgi:hypothetical protein
VVGRQAMIDGAMGTFLAVHFQVSMGDREG